MYARRALKYLGIPAMILVAVYFTNSLIHDSQSYKRDVQTLLNYYYTYKNTDPLKAKEALELVLKQDSDNGIALKAMVDWYLRQGDTYNALQLLKTSYERHPENQFLASSLISLYRSLNENDKADRIADGMSEGAATYSTPLARLGARVWRALKEGAPLAQEALTTSSKQSFLPVYQTIQGIMAVDPKAAKTSLLQMTKLDSGSAKPFIMLGYLALKESNKPEAVTYLEQAFAIQPTPELAMQLGYLVSAMNDTPKAKHYFEYVLTQKENNYQVKAREALAVLDGLSRQAEGVSQSLEYQLWSAYYQLKQANSPKAWVALMAVLKQTPNDINALKEAAYWSSAHHDPTTAIEYWKRVYSIDKNPTDLLNIAYLYDGMGMKWRAFNYFGQAAASDDFEVHMKAELAMTAMGGSQFKIFPDPAFVEFYTAPFYYGRFDLGVLPTILRGGVRINEAHHSELYLNFRRTKDNRSGASPGGLVSQFALPQIFEDNVAIYGVGFRMNPWPEKPFLLFSEVGSAKDLTYRNRKIWRGDFRGGAVFSKLWGAKPTYTDGLKFHLDWVASMYSDLIYYSRYNNLIGTAWFRPGFRVATFQSASVQLYMANYYIVDSRREFYNNIYSLGPGIAVQPTNRLNLVLRLESLNGYYLPVNSPMKNPYAPSYYNLFVMTEFFIRF